MKSDRLKIILIIFSLILFLLSILVKADDSVYIKSDKIIEKMNDTEIIFRIINSDSIMSDIIIDENNLYYMSYKNLYSVNKTNGNINFKVSITNAKYFSQSQNNIYVSTYFYLYKVNKSSGIIETKLHGSLIDSIYSYFQVSGTGSGNTYVNNYYSNTSLENVEFITNKSSDINLGSSNDLYPTQNATKSYIDSKVNKSGDTMTGKLLSNTSSTGLTGVDLNYSFEAKYDNVQRTYLYRASGIQEWFVNNSAVDAGWITYSTPGSVPSPGIVMYNNTRKNRSDFRSSPFGIEFWAFAPNTTTPGSTYSVAINRITGDLLIHSLSGSGNAYLCVDSTGKLYRGTPNCQII